VTDAQGAIRSGEYTYEQWRDMFDPEVELLNRECPEQMQGHDKFVAFRLALKFCHFEERSD
jgi:hypothetical protein